MSKQANIAYRICGFELPQFKTSWESLDVSKGLEIKNNIDFAFSSHDRILKCTLQLLFSQSDINILEIEFCTYVEIHPDSYAELIQEDEIVFPPYFLAQCASFGHGALRGIMFLKTTNTPLENYIIPPVEYGKVFKDPFVAKIE